MKKFVLFCLSFYLCFLSLSAHANQDFTNFPSSMPFTYNGYTYNYVAKVYGEIAFFNDLGYYNYTNNNTYALNPNGGFNTYYNNNYLFANSNYWGTYDPSKFIMFRCNSSSGVPTWTDCFDTPNTTDGWQSVAFDASDNNNIHNFPIWTTDGSILISANNYTKALHQLSIVINPQIGGTVTGMPGVLSCNNGTCTSTFNGSETLTAAATDGWAFGFWDDGATITDNSYTFNLSSNKTIFAIFFRTFGNTVGNFYAEIGDNGGECVDYVKTETGITKADGNVFNGDAWEYYQEAISANYKTGDVPRIGSIAVFDKSTFPDYGHVGIVKDYYVDSQTQHLHLVLRHSNWCVPATCHTVSENDVDVDGKVIHYIYYTP